MPLPPIMHSSNTVLPLAFDIGFNTGDDTALMLLQAYRVVAIEANPLLVERGRVRFAQAIQSGRLTLLNIALANDVALVGQLLPFFVNAYKHEWSSFEQRVGCRQRKSAAGFIQNMNHGRGSHNRTRSGGTSDSTTELLKHCRRLDVVAVSCAKLFQEHGIPHVLKLDAEGAEWPCVQALEQFGSRPSYVSIELAVQCCNSTQLDFFHSLGYERFKWVNQAPFQSTWGSTSGPIGEFSLDCMRGYSWRDLSSTGRLLEQYFTPQLAGRFRTGSQMEKQCNYWSDLQLKHRSMLY